MTTVHMKKWQLKARVTRHEPVAFEHFAMELEAPQIARSAIPGQFVHILPPEGGGLLLRRPFSLYRIRRDRIEILYRVVGVGTVALSRTRVGDTLDVLGPLGTRFTAPEGKKKFLIVGGGVGVPPLVLWAEALLKEGVPASEIFVFLGFRSRNVVICEKDFKKMGVSVRVATDDGTAGRKGLVTDLLKEFLRKEPFAPVTTQAYSCGPWPMMGAVAAICKKERIACQASLEQHMGCALGACLGCVVETTRGYERVCTEGPVFDAADVRF